MIAVLHEIQLRNPWWLLLALQPMLLWLLAYLRQRWRRDGFADADLLPWVRSTGGLRTPRRWWRPLLLILAWCCLAIAMAGPRLLQGRVASAQSILPRLELVVDLSYSMSARDIRPSRLQRVKLELHDLLTRLQPTRVGLIVYAARAHVMLPPTSDGEVLASAIDLLRVRELPTEGSNMYAALQLARAQLRANSSRGGAILLLSDGETSDDRGPARQRLSQLVTALREDNIHLFTFGVAGLQGAALLDGQQGWLQADGHPVVSRLHATRLQTLAREGNGVYTEVMDDDSDWRAVYDDGIARLQTVTTADSGEGNAIWRDLSPWFVMPGGLLLLLAALRLPQLRGQTAFAWAMVVVLLTGTCYPPRARAAPPAYPDGLALYRAGKFEAAARVFAALPGYAARMAEAASRYRQKQYAHAAAGYIQAMLDADNDAQRGAALFNLANSYFKQQDYARAAAAYRDALHYQPDFAPARINLAYARDLEQRQQQTQAGPVDRAGTGSRSAPAVPQTEVGKGRVSLGESTNKSKAGTPPSSDTGSRQGADRLRLQLVEPATQQVQLDKDVQWTYEIQRAQDIRPQDIRFAVDETVFWQRLYESEEDYPAPRERPEILPGVPPW